jgi:magnesium transporter
VGAVSFGAAWLLTGEIEPAIVVSTTVFLVVVMASVAGAALPIIVHSFHVDPAYMSTPLIAALVDVAGVIIYFNVAFLVFGQYPPF